MHCENCKIPHTGDYGSGRFCSSKCARGFSTKAKRSDINARVSKKLTGIKTNNHVWTDEDREKAKIAFKAKKELDRELQLTILDFDLLSVRFKRERILREQNFKCLECGISQEWNGKFLKFQLDHIDGNKKTKFDNRRENLRLLCPNCHTQTPTHSIGNPTPETIAKMKKGAIKGGQQAKGRTGLTGFKILSPGKK